MDAAVRFTTALGFYEGVRDVPNVYMKGWLPEVLFN
jgi:hypothetical protein